VWGGQEWEFTFKKRHRGKKGRSCPSEGLTFEEGVFRFSLQDGLRDLGMEASWRESIHRKRASNGSRKEDTEELRQIGGMYLP